MKINQLLTHEVETNLPSEQCALLLSGGVDSLSVAFAAHALGKSVHAYSFQLFGEPSSDYAKAKYVAQVMGWNFTGIEIPTENLTNDFHRLLKLGCQKKTHFECLYPFLYVYPEIEEKYVLSGWAADGYYGLSRNAFLRWGVKTSKQSFDAYRDDYFQSDKCAGFQQHKIVADIWGKIHVAPYLADTVKQFFYQFDWHELNYPYEKHHIRNAFPQFSSIGKVGKHSNLQVNAGIPALFETLLSNKDINFNQRGRVMDICKDWVKKNEHGSLELFL